MSMLSEPFTYEIARVRQRELLEFADADRMRMRAPAPRARPLLSALWRLITRRLTPRKALPRRHQAWQLPK
jgi:hypothetical protein